MGFIAAILYAQNGSSKLNDELMHYLTNTKEVSIIRMPRWTLFLFCVIFQILFAIIVTRFCELLCDTKACDIFKNVTTKYVTNFIISTLL